MPYEYLELVMEHFRKGRLRFGRNTETGEGVLAIVIENEAGGEERLVPVARLIACPPRELPPTELAEA